MDVTEVNVVTGEVTERNYTQQELDDNAAVEVIALPKRLKARAMKDKRQADKTALGTRSEMQAEIDGAINVPKLKALVAKLAEIVYSNEKGTID